MHLTTPSINLVAACSARKVVEPSALMMLRNVRGRTPKDRLAEWIMRISGSGGEGRIQAKDLYCGESWKILTSSISGCPPPCPKLWVASAGYGLISADQELLPYSATFSPRQEDSVSSGHFDKCATPFWWNGLSESSAKNGRSPVSISDLAQQFPGTPLLLCLSPPYIKAALADIVAASEHLNNPDLLIIVSAGSKKRGKLAPYFLPCDSRLLAMFGGSRMTLNARIVRYIITNTKPSDLRASFLKAQFVGFLNQQQSIPTSTRSGVTAEKLAIWISIRLSKDRLPSKTGLLKLLRAEGHACELKRFGNIYDAVVANAI